MGKCTTNTNAARAIIQDHIIDCLPPSEIKRYAEDNDSKTWALYRHLIAREFERAYQKLLTQQKSTR